MIVANVLCVIIYIFVKNCTVITVEIGWDEESVIHSIKTDLCRLGQK